MTDFFFYGTLCHLPLLKIVLGREVASRAAQLPDHAVNWAEAQPFPTIQSHAGSLAQGILVQGLTPEDIARLNFYEGAFDYRTEVLRLTDGSMASVYLPPKDQGPVGPAWDLADWLQRYGLVVTETAKDVMALYGQKPAQHVHARYGQMLIRAASRLRAAQGSNSQIRRRPDARDIEIVQRHEPYANFFSVEEYDLRHRRFDGSMSPQINRAGFVSGDAATVLPYDPKRDRVMVIEQFRVGPFVRGDANPWLLEAIAGRVDAYETPEDCARREAQEEAGLVLHELIEVAKYYPSPGAKAEFLYSYVALCDLPDLTGGLGGVATEAEDIRSHILPFDRFMELLYQPECANAPLMLTGMWLAAQRDRLRQGL